MMYLLYLVVTGFIYCKVVILIFDRLSWRGYIKTEEAEEGVVLIFLLAFLVIAFLPAMLKLSWIPYVL